MDFLKANIPRAFVFVAFASSLAIPGPHGLKVGLKVIDQHGVSAFGLAVNTDETRSLSIS
jgi:hypothetical protein